MPSPLQSQFESLIPTALASAAAWRFYRGRSSQPDERYATFWPRLWAGFIDGLVLWPVRLLAAGMNGTPMPREWQAALYTLQGFPSVAYTIWLHAHGGQTVGKMVTHVRVVDAETGGPLTPTQACVREIIPLLLMLGMTAYMVPRILHGTIDVTDAAAVGAAAAHDTALQFTMAIPLLWFLAELVTMLTNDRRRALHDLLAGTVVVRSNVAPAVAASAELAG